MHDASLMTDAVRAALARPRPPRSVSVDRLALRRLMEALGERRPAPDPGEPAPIYALSLLEQSVDVVELPPGLEGSLVAGDEWELVRAPRVGEELSCHTRVLDAYERFGGRFGQSLYLRSEWTYTDAAGTVIATARRIILRFPRPRDGARE